MPTQPTSGEVWYFRPAIRTVISSFGFVQASKMYKTKKQGHTAAYEDCFTALYVSYFLPLNTPPC